jgi:Xaa-Pro aminopeptidase
MASRLSELAVDAFLITRPPNVRYLTGFTGSNGQLLLSPAGGVLMTDGRYTAQAGRQAPDLRRVVYSGEFPPAFQAACADLGVRRAAFEAAGLTYGLHADLAAGGIELVPTSDEVERFRWVKDIEELEQIRAAQAIADEAFERITALLTEDMTERDLALELDLSMRRAGAEAPAFETIVAFGEGAAEPHHRPTERRLRSGDCVKLDFGCVVGGYHSDMTRTVAFGPMSDELLEVYEVVRKAQQAGIDAVGPGIEGGAADAAVRDIVRDAGYAESYPHSLGHGVGLEVHEGPALRHGSRDVLPAGAVVTVEPGIYLNGIGGVRIEDMVEVTADGCRVIPQATKELLVL